uniref:Uncharacterized protein n=1 Tax=Stegastes partitus TaxID=144197 RepID=A0A3B5AXH1_9TELE
MRSRVLKTLRISVTKIHISDRRSPSRCRVCRISFEDCMRAFASRFVRVCVHRALRCVCSCALSLVRKKRPLIEFPLISRQPRLAERDACLPAAQRHTSGMRSRCWPVHLIYHGSPLRSAPLDPVQHLFSHQGMLCWRGMAMPLYRLALPSWGSGKDEV